MARTALSAFFTASLLCGLAILSCTYLARTKGAAVLPAAHTGRRLLQAPAATSSPDTSAPAAVSSSPAAPLRPPPASPSAAPPTPAASPAGTEATEPVPAEPAAQAANTPAAPDSTSGPADAGQAAGGVADPAGAAPNFNGTAPNLNATVDDTLDPAADPTPGWQFPWKKFWTWTGFLCAGTGACGLVSGLVLGTLQGFGACQSCSSCDPEAAAPKSTATTASRPPAVYPPTTTASSRYASDDSCCDDCCTDCCECDECCRHDGCCRGELAVCGCLFGLFFLAVGVYLVMPMAAACLGYGSGYVVGAALSTALVLACPCTEGCRARRTEWREAWASRAAAARARAGLPPLAAPAVELPSAKVTSDATDAGCKAGGEHDMHSVDLEATAAPQQQPGFELY